MDVGAPAYVDQLPDDVSSLILAEAIERRLRHPHDPVEREAQRLAYLAEKSPEIYARRLLALVEEAIGWQT